MNHLRKIMTFRITESSFLFIDIMNAKPLHASGMMPMVESDGIST